MQDISRRRVPRRTFEAPVGVLCHGKYFVERSLQVGEGGMRILSEYVLNENDLVVLSFQIPDGSLISVRGIVRYADKDNNGKYSFGVQFENLEFQYKRELRNFVAAATQASIFA